MEALYYSAPDAPPCVHYEGGEGDQRLLAVWTFVSGLAGGGQNAAGIAANIAGLYDHKGQLVVGLRQPLQPHVEELFRYAWEVVGFEPRENAEFVDVMSADVDRYGIGCRFDTDWKP